MDRPAPLSILLRRLWPAAFLLLGGCFDAAERGPDPEVLHRLNQLQTELDVLKSQQGGQTPILQDRLAELQRRVEELETAGGQSQDSLTQQSKLQDAQIQRMFRSVNEMHEMLQSGQTWATFGLGYEGHTVARTRHGSFLVELEGQDKEAASYTLRLRIGNPSGMQVHQFKIYGDFGEPPPVQTAAGDYNAYIKAIDRWESTLKHFDKSFLTTLEPDVWTNVNLSVSADKLSELRFIRFRMVVERASLVKAAVDDDQTHIGIDQRGATVFQTKHGTFPVTVGESRQTGNQYALDLVIGNPLGMTITSARLVGHYGPKPPSLELVKDTAEYSRQLALWNETLTPFDVDLKRSLLPFHWNPVEIKLTAAKRSDLAYIRCRMEITNVSLRNPE